MCLIFSTLGEYIGKVIKLCLTCITMTASVKLVKLQSARNFFVNHNGHVLSLFNIGWVLFIR